MLRTLVPGVFSPLLGVSGPREGEKGENEIFVTIGVNGEFLYFNGFSAISQQRVDGSTPNSICAWDNFSRRVLPPLGSIRPWGAGGGGVKNSKNGGGSVVRFGLVVTRWLRST